MGRVPCPGHLQLVSVGPIGPVWVRLASRGPKPNRGRLSGRTDRIAIPGARFPLCQTHPWGFPLLRMAQAQRQTLLWPAERPFGCVGGCLGPRIPPPKKKMDHQSARRRFFFSEEVTLDHSGCLQMCLQPVARHIWAFLRACVSQKPVNVEPVWHPQNGAEWANAAWALRAPQKNIAELMQKIYPRTTLRR